MSNSIEVFDNIEVLTRNLDHDTVKRISEIIVACYKQNEGNTYTQDQISLMTSFYRINQENDNAFLIQRFRQGFGVLYYDDSIKPENLKGSGLLINWPLKSEDDFAWQIKMMYVDPDYQQSGIGSTILNKLEEEARDIGLHELALTSTVFPSTIKFYEKNDYSLVEPFIAHLNRAVSMEFQIMKKDLTKQ